MRLIDADVLIEAIKSQKVDNDAYCKMCIETMSEIADEQPTAYDLETVIKQLEEFKAEAEQFNVLGLVTDMIEVVRKGGVDNE